MNKVEEALLIEEAKRRNHDYPLRHSRFNDLLRAVMTLAFLAIAGLGFVAFFDWLLG